MARIRSIKPGFWSDVKVCKKLPPLARLFFVALWNFADDFGRGRAIPRELLGFAFPYDADISANDISEWLRLMNELGMITLYEVEESPYYNVTNWAEHQKIHNPTPSQIPAFEICENFSGEIPEFLPKSSRETSQKLRVGIRNQEVGSRNQEVGSGREFRETATPPAEPDIADVPSPPTLTILPSDVLTPAQRRRNDAGRAVTSGGSMQGEPFWTELCGLGYTPEQICAAMDDLQKARSPAEIEGFSTRSLVTYLKKIMDGKVGKNWIPPEKQGKTMQDDRDAVRALLQEAHR